MPHADSWDQVSPDMRTDLAGDRDRQVAPHAGQQPGVRMASGWRRGFGGADRNAVPEEGLLLGAPLLLEAIRARTARGPAEVESSEAVSAGRPDGVPVQEHVRAEREVLLQARRPRDDHPILERERDESADGRAPFCDEHDARARPERIDHVLKEPESVDRRPKVAHPLDERVVKRRPPAASALLHRETGALRLANLIAHALVESSPQTVRLVE